MSEPLTDKEINAIAQRFSHSCPNCGGLLAIQVDDRRVSSAERAVLDEVTRRGGLHIVPVEENARTLREFQEAGRFSDSAIDDIRKVMRND
jgi:hypothetical protein